MLLIVILNAVLAVMIVSVMVALHGKAILTDEVQQRRLVARERRRAARPEPRPAGARTAVGTTRRSVSSAA